MGYYLFDSGGIVPWSTKWNMFVPERNEKQPTIHVFESHHAALKEQAAESFNGLIAWMLETDLRRRPMAKDVLEHAALRDVVGTIASNSDQPRP